MGANSFNFKKCIAFGLLFALSLFLLIGCNGNEDPSETTPQEPIGHITMSIFYPEQAELENVEALELPFYSENDTVLDVLKAYCKENDLLVSVKKDSFTYVEGINGVFEKDFGESTGWVFEVNDEMVMEEASVCKAKDGDHIVWKYIDYTEMSM